MGVAHLIVRGRVQGVGFRWYVQERARALALRGWVRNRRDGSVEVDAEGPPEALDALVKALWAGPRGAYVTSVQEATEPETSSDRPYPFSIVR